MRRLSLLLALFRLRASTPGLGGPDAGPGVVAATLGEVRVRLTGPC